MSELKIGDVVQLKDYKTVREGSYRHREYYEKLAHPDARYVIQQITPFKEVYVHGKTQYFNYDLLELCSIS